MVSDNSGGAIVAWIDYRRFQYDIYAERLDGNGNPLWSPGGVVLAANDSILIGPLAMPDGAGGAFVVFGQVTESGLYSDVLVQHVTSTGALFSGWPANGKSVAPGGASGFGAVPTNDGFLLMGWTDLAGQIRLVCITSAGGYAFGWNPAGLAIGHPQSENTISPAPDGGGGAYICWAESDSVMLTRVANTGSIASGWSAAGTVVNSGTSVPTAGVAAALLTGGDVMVFWPDFRSSNLDLYAMRYTSAGAQGSGWAAGGVLALGGPGFEVRPEAVPDGAGGALVISQVGAADSIVAQRMTGSGAISSGWPVAGVTLAKHQGKYTSSPISDGANGAIIAWSGTKSMSEGVFAQRVGSGGALLGAWPGAAPKAVSDTTDDQSFPQIATDGNSGMIGVWEDYRDGGSRIYAARVLFDGTVGTLAALISASAEPGLVRLHWYSENGAFEAGLERTVGDGAFVEIARVRADAGHIRYEDRDVTAGGVYRYRLVLEEDGATSYLGDVTLRVPEGRTLSLAGFVPNPAVGAPRLAYALPAAERARVEVLDTAGRRVLERDLDSSPGEHVVSLDGASLGPGVYVLRLTQGSRSVTARAAIVR